MSRRSAPSRRRTSEAEEKKRWRPGALSAIIFFNCSYPECATGHWTRLAGGLLMRASVAHKHTSRPPAQRCLSSHMHAHIGPGAWTTDLDRRTAQGSSLSGASKQAYKQLVAQLVGHYLLLVATWEAAAVVWQSDEAAATIGPKTPSRRRHVSSVGRDG